MNQTTDQTCEEEEIWEQTSEEDSSLDLPKEKRRVYSDKNDRSIYELERKYSEGDWLVDPDFQR